MVQHVFGFAESNGSAGRAVAKKLARRSDPQTSHQAATEIETKLNPVQTLVMECAVLSGESFTAREIAEVCKQRGGAADTETYRKRCRELVNLNQLRELEVRTCQVTGKKATTFEVMRSVK